MKKTYKEYYKQSKKVNYVDVPEMIYLTVEGQGNPNTSKTFARHIELLYKFSYKLRMSYKKDYNFPDFEIYTVGPLEGIWTTVNNKAYESTDKDNLKYKLMINQPQFFTKEIFELLKKELVAENNEFEQVRYELITEGKCVQIMHVGTYDSEPETLEAVFNDLETKGLNYVPWSHHEIYLSDMRRVAPEKLKTLIRYQINE